MKKSELALISFLFLGFAFFSCFRHDADLSWDFCAYVINAQHFFYDGSYVETVRPPLVSVLLAPTLPLGVAGEYAYIIFICILFLYSSMSLANYLFDERDKRLVFYFFNLSAYMLVYSFITGSELLALALIGLFLRNVMQGKVSGHYLALAVLTRYTFLPFLPFVFINKNWKTIVYSLLVFGLVVSPWLLYNYSVYDDPLASMVDSYTLNVLNRGYMVQPFTFAPLFKVIGLFAPFFLLGIAASFVKVLESERITPFAKGAVLLAVIFVMVLFQFGGIPYKLPRYLFALVLPVAFFSATGFFWLCARYDFVQKYAKYLLLIWFGATVAFWSVRMHDNRTFDDRFYVAASKIKELGLDDYELVSPYWVHMRYLAGTGNPIKESIAGAISGGKIVLIFKGSNYRTIDDKFTLQTLKRHPVIFETNEYVILGSPPYRSKSGSIPLRP